MLSHDAVASKRLHDGLRKQPLRLTGEHVAYSMKTIHDVFLIVHYFLYSSFPLFFFSFFEAALFCFERTRKKDTFSGVFLNARQRSWLRDGFLRGR